MDLGYYTNTEMVNLAFDFAKVLLGTSQPQPRSTSCTMLANNLLSFALSAKYVTVAFDEDAKLEVSISTFISRKDKSPFVFVSD